MIIAPARSAYMPVCGAVLRVAHFPAERVQFVAQFIAFLPIFCKPRLLALLRQLRHFCGNRDLRLRFEIEDSVDPFPPIEPSVRGRGVEFVFVHCAVRFANRFEQESERRGNVQIIIERFFKLLRWTLGVGRSRVGRSLFLQLRAIAPSHSSIRA